ncbi:MAG: DUF4430 domain-containing protein [Firmicutes bacterium]|nr:DUF4430 domain-containing protein [Bacillota bacterium]
MAESKQIVVEEESSAEESSVVEDSSAPEEDSSVPEEDSSVPEEDSSVPEEDSSVPEEDSSVPEEDSSAPEEDSSVPEEDSSVPEEDSSVPEEDSSVPEEESSVPEESSADETPTNYCTLTIRCDTILNNWDNLDPAKAGYVPSDGIILYYATVEFTPGESVFDVLQRTCANYGIQLEYSWTPMYDSYYIEGINNLYEFDCGGSSGWMYKVNGWFPNYGCSSYPLSDGDDIVWCYTCVGLGEDVGA